MKGENFDKQRVISFSDAVFSIAITLLVLDIVAPTYKELKAGDTLQILENRIPSFIGLIVSFIVISLYWVAHMRIMKYVSTINKRILRYNTFLLFFIVLLPFSTAFYVRGFMLKGPFAFYCFNLSAIGFFNYLLNIYIPKKENGLTGITPILAKYFKYRSLIAFIVWVLAGLFAFLLPMFARFLFLFIFILEAILVKIYKKKLISEKTIL
ncbi:TMEM175 family protein [uncultured Polaribacter sp.]|uniref:TMEM175 family protein n=1 Tax=uncultured Polaribacter sp. TaxID=174711 RepID=UPI00262E92A8|nr:TMEM175 family protein [uncultured Polaribacter sp.]